MEEVINRLHDIVKSRIVIILLLVVRLNSLKLFDLTTIYFHGNVTYYISIKDTSVFVEVL